MSGGGVSSNQTRLGSHEGLSASNPVDEMDIGINEVRISTDLEICPPSGLAMQKCI